VPQVRCLDAAGNMLGVMATMDAIRMAQEQQLDLVEISPNAEPPVCRIMDFGKFRYEESLKEKEARKRQHRQVVKEIKFHANVGEHDFQTKLGHIKGFLADGNKVKVSLVFRGRENVHREIGFEVINRVIKECSGVCSVDMSPRMMGRMLIAMLGGKAAKA
jgi:translation initiation factor IF-3